MLQTGLSVTTLAAIIRCPAYPDTKRNIVAGDGGKVMQIDRRRYQRYSFKKQVYAVFKPEPVRMLPIIDIGMGGMSVSDTDGLVEADTDAQLEIMSSDCSFFLDKVPFHFISVTEGSRVYPAVPDNLRIIHLRFGRLPSSQESELRYLIRHYCTGSHRPQAARRFARFFEQFRAFRTPQDSCRRSFSEFQGPTR
jgi:hypothetical protein